MVIRSIGKPAEVICQHKTDGSIIPIKIRIAGDDGELQIYHIRTYKDMSGGGEYTTPDGVSSAGHTHKFDCTISVFGRDKLIHLFYNAYDNFWKVTY